MPSTHPYPRLTHTPDSPIPPTHPYPRLTHTPDSPIPPTHPYPRLTHTPDSPIPPTHPYPRLTRSPDSPIPPTHPYPRLTMPPTHHAPDSTIAPATHSHAPRLTMPPTHRPMPPTHHALDSPMPSNCSKGPHLTASLVHIFHTCSGLRPRDTDRLQARSSCTTRTSSHRARCSDAPALHGAGGARSALLRRVRRAQRPASSPHPRRAARVDARAGISRGGNPGRANAHATRIKRRKTVPRRSGITMPTARAAAAAVLAMLAFGVIVGSLGKTSIESLASSPLLLAVSCPGPQAPAAVAPDSTTATDSSNSSSSGPPRLGPQVGRRGGPRPPLAAPASESSPSASTTKQEGTDSTAGSGGTTVGSGGGGTGGGGSSSPAGASADPPRFLDRALRSGVRADLRPGLSRPLPRRPRCGTRVS